MQEDLITSNSAAETRDHGRKFAGSLKGGDVVALSGPLGAGKTHFAQGVCEGLGGEAAEVASPTFALIREYAGGGLRLPFYHMDFYRLESPEEALALGLDEYLAGDGVTLIEWADRFPELLPRGTHWVELQLPENEDGRILRFWRG